MEIAEVCLTTGIKVLLGTLVGIKVSQRIYKMFKSLHPKRTSKFSSGKVEKYRRQVGKGSCSNIEIETFAIQKEIEHQAALPIIDLDTDMIDDQKRVKEDPNTMEIKDTLYSNEIKHHKDTVENQVNVQDYIEIKNNVDKTEHLYVDMDVQENEGEDSNLKIHEAKVPIISSDDDKEIKNVFDDIRDLYTEKENMKSREGGLMRMDNDYVKMAEVRLLKESAQNLSDAVTEVENNTSFHECRYIDIDMKKQKSGSDVLKICKVENTIKMPEEGFHWVKVNIPDDKFDDLYHEDIGLYENEILGRNEDQIIPVIIKDEIENHDIVLDTEFYNKIKTDSALIKLTVEHDSSNNEGMHQKISNSKVYDKNFSKSILQEAEMDQNIKGQCKNAKVSLRKLLIPGINKVTGNEQIRLSEGLLEWEVAENMSGVKNIPSLLTAKPKEVTVNLDPLPSYMIKNLKEEENIKFERRSTGALKKTRVKSDRVAKTGVKHCSIIEDPGIRNNGEDSAGLQIKLANLTIFPPTPPSPPPQGWMNATSLWELDAADFGAVTSLCGLEVAAEMKRKINTTKPLVRVLRKH